MNHDLWPTRLCVLCMRPTRLCALCMRHRTTHLCVPFMRIHFWPIRPSVLFTRRPFWHIRLCDPFTRHLSSQFRLLTAHLPESQSFNYPRKTSLSAA